MSEAIYDADEERWLRRRNLLRRERAESIVHFYQRGGGLHHLPLEEFTKSPEREDDFKEDDQDDEEKEENKKEIELLTETYAGELYLDEEEDDSGFRRPPNEVEGILEKLSRVDIKGLEADDRKCSICQSEYGKHRRGDDKTKKPVSASDTSDYQMLPDDESPEHPVMLPCGHLLGELCISKWLEEAQPASCPLCRHKL